MWNLFKSKRGKKVKCARPLPFPVLHNQFPKCIFSHPGTSNRNMLALAKTVLGEKYGEIGYTSIPITHMLLFAIKTRPSALHSTSLYQVFV